MPNDPHWLVSYVEHTKRQESPEAYHIWTGISILAATLGRKVWLARRAGGVTRYSIYPGQLMIILTAGSGLVRKSTAISPAKKFLKSIKKPLISGKTSVEAFLKQMDQASGGEPQAMLLESELTSFLSKATYLDPLVDVLCKLADAEDEFPYTTIAHGKIIIKNPCLTLLSCTTPESLGSRLPPSATGAGLMSRIIFIYAKETNRIEDLSDVEDDDLSPAEVMYSKLVEQRLYDGLRRINSAAGPFTFAPSGREWFKKFYLDWIKSPSGQGEGYPARRPDHLLRVAMCFAAGRDSKILCIDDQSLAFADRILSAAEKDFDKAFAFVGTSYTKDRQRIVDYIAVKGGKVPQSDLLSAMYVYFKDLETLKRTLALLQEAGVLKSELSPKHPQQLLWSLSGIDFKI